MPVDSQQPSPDFWEMQLESWVRLACYLEVATPKPGNVHPGAGFHDVTCQHFVSSADIVAPILAKSARQGVGQSIWNAVSQVQTEVGTNTNLGIILLLAPLCAVAEDCTLQSGVEDVLSQLTVTDAKFVYRAIRLTAPGGLGEVDEHDVARPPTINLREAMTAAAERDTIAAQYANGFELIWEQGLPQLENVSDFSRDWQSTILRLFLHLMSYQPDTLIARKCGWKTARVATDKAAFVLQQGADQTAAGQTALAGFDDWLRAEGHRRNPGTTADLVAACLFAALRNGIIEAPPLAEIQKLF